MEIIYNKFLKNRILSRWFVLSIDLLIVLVATLVSYYITLHIYKAIPSLEAPVLHKYVSFTVGITLFYFFILQTYVGIIRYSTIIEFYRSFLALLLSSTSIFLYLFFLKKSSGSISLGYCLTFLLFAFLGIFFFRILVISSFRYLQNKYSSRIVEVFLWGVSEQSIAMAQFLNTPQSGYRVRGFCISSN